MITNKQMVDLDEMIPGNRLCEIDGSDREFPEPVHEQEYYRKLHRYVSDQDDVERIEEWMVLFGDA
jgi:hypothetical protein